MPVRDPYDSLRRVAPRSGPPVQNMRGQVVRDPAMRRIGQPAVRRAAPGPRPFSSMGPRPAMTAPDGGGPMPTANLVYAEGDPGPGVPPTGPPTPVPPTAPPTPVPPTGPPTPVPPQPGPPPVGSLSLDQTIEDYIRRAMGAEGGGIPQDVINQMKVGALSAAEGRRKASVDVGNEDLAARGLLRSGIGARLAADAARGAASDYTRAVSDIMAKKAEADAAARQAASGTALSLLEMNRRRDEQAAQLAAQERMAAAARAPRMFTYIDPDTGEEYQLDESMF